MECWIRIHNCENWISNYKRIVDAWEDGGIRGIALGHLNFTQADGSGIRTYSPDPKIYESYGVSPPPEGPYDSEKEKKLHEILDDVASRGWQIMLFEDAVSAGGNLPLDKDPYGEMGFAATMQDLMNAYPQANGIVLDGVGEQRYELASRRRGDLFVIDEEERQHYSNLGFDIDRMDRGIAHLRQRFHNLSPDLVRYHAPGGMLAGMSLFDINEDSLYWIRSRQEIMMSSFAALRKAIDSLNRKVEMATLPRTAAFSSLTGQNLQQMASYFDYIIPKHYFWNRGFDGMYGTIQRWVQTLLQWNPSLSEEDGLSVTKSLFGLELPGVQSLLDLEMGFPDEFFSKVVYNETRRVLEAIQDNNKVLCWVSTGLSPHGGDPMPARDLHGILQASKDAGLKRFIFHPEQPDLGVPEWQVISRMCGNPWKEKPGSYWPAGTSKEDSLFETP